jgi:L-ascorbate metabolism protein UlaG (beta-lactamase superfamily)
MILRILLIAIGFWANSILASEVEVLWLGHATVKFTSVEGKVIVIDPFLKQNPKTPAKYKDLKALGHVDLILITHGHADHTRDLEELASLTGAKVVTPYGFGLNMISLGILDQDKTIIMNKGGTVSPIGRGIKVSMVPAEHGSNIDFALPGLSADPMSLRVREGGPAVGFVIEFENGFSVYHSGDTGVFGDMELIHEFYQPDLAMVCIGGHFTMDPAGAAYAIKKLLKPKKVIPIHYGTYPVINRTPAEFIEAMDASPIEIVVMQPGQTLRF